MGGVHCFLFEHTFYPALLRFYSSIMVVRPLWCDFVLWGMDGMLLIPVPTHSYPPHTPTFSAVASSSLHPPSFPQKAQVITHDLRAAAPGPSANTTR